MDGMVVQDNLDGFSRANTGQCGDILPIATTTVDINLKHCASAHIRNPNVVARIVRPRRAEHAIEKAGQVDSVTLARIKRA